MNRRRHNRSGLHIYHYLGEGDISIDVPSDPALNHNFIYNDREECYFCAYCSNPYHGTPEAYAEADAEDVTFGHTVDEDAFEIVDGSINWSEDHSTCTVTLRSVCGERHCGSDVEKEENCEVTSSERMDAVPDDPNNPDHLPYKKIYTATYKGKEIDVVTVFLAFMLGDVNEDGEVDASDLLRQHRANDFLRANRNPDHES